MKVIDAGVVVELLVGGLDPDVIEDDEIAVPHLLDSEVLHALRGLVLRNELSLIDAETALSAFGLLVLTRYPAASLRPRIWELRHNLTAYDATYVALAELSDADVLLTTDARLAHATGPRCEIRVVDAG